VSFVRFSTTRSLLQFKSSTTIDIAAMKLGNADGDPVAHGRAGSGSSLCAGGPRRVEQFAGAMAMARPCA
jgi:hypothetical protein